MASLPYRIVLSSALIAPLLAMSAFEFWRGRAERLPSRWPVIVIFASFALFFAARIPLIGHAAVSVRRAADASQAGSAPSIW